MVFSTAVLLVLALPVLQLRPRASPTRARCRPRRRSGRRTTRSRDGFGAGTNGPLLIAVKLATPAKSARRRIDPRLTGLVRRGRNDAGRAVGRVRSTVDKSGTAAVFTAVATTAPAASQTEDLVNTLRDSVIPKAVAGTGLAAYVGGKTAGYIDLAEKIAEQAAAHDRVVVLLSYLRPADARVPVGRDPAQGRGDEPALDRRRIRRRHVAVFQDGWRRSSSGSPARDTDRLASSRCSCSRSCSGSRWTTRSSS